VIVAAIPNITSPAKTASASPPRQLPTKNAAPANHIHAKKALAPHPIGATRTTGRPRARTGDAPSGSTAAIVAPPHARSGRRAGASGYGFVTGSNTFVVSKGSWNASAIRVM
jgi:hypothetical protein